MGIGVLQRRGRQLLHLRNLRTPLRSLRVASLTEYFSFPNAGVSGPLNAPRRFSSYRFRRLLRSSLPFPPTPHRTGARDLYGTWRERR